MNELLQGTELTSEAFGRLIHSVGIGELRADPHTGGPGAVALRAVTWRLLLGLLPLDAAAGAWAARAAEGRARYAALKAEHMPDLTKLSSGDPLSSLFGGRSTIDRFQSSNSRPSVLFFSRSRSLA